MDYISGFRAIPVEKFSTWANLVETSKPGRDYRFRPELAAISTGVASFNRYLLIGICLTGLL